MDIIEFILHKNDYNHNSNEKWINHLIELGDEAVYLCSEIVAHILWAHHIWNCRMTFSPYVHDILELKDPFKWNFYNDQFYQLTHEIIMTREISEVINFHDSADQPYQRKIIDIIFHIINHSSYHRGQLSTTLSDNNIKSLGTDYIKYIEE